MSDEAMRLQPAPLIIDDPWARVTSFFTLDGSLKYDNYIAAGTSPPNRIVEDDVVAINTSMSARSPHVDWQRFFDAVDDLPQLATIDPGWDLIELPDNIWTEADVPRLLEALFDSVVGPGIGISRATKVLHIKRPALISVCDSYVLQPCQWPIGTARWRPAEVPAGGHVNCPLADISSAVGC